MPQFPLMVDIITYLTTNTHPSPRNLILKTRYRHPDQLPMLVEFLSFILVSTNVNTPQPIQFFKVIQLLRELIIEADLYISLLLLTKVSPMMNSKSYSSSKKAALQSRFRQWLDNGGQKVKKISNSINENTKQVVKLFEWIENYKYFEFYLQSINCHTQQDYQNLNAFLSEIEKQKQSPFNKIQRNFFKTQMLTQYEKLSNNKYKLETVKCVYQWIKAELKQAFAEPFDKYSSLLSIDTLSRIIRADCDLACSAMVQALQYVLPNLKTTFLEHYLQIVDEMMLSSGAKTLIQVVLVLVPAIFLKAVDPKAKIKSDLMSLHFDFWRYAMSKRYVESNLLMCLNDWTKRILGEGKDNEEKMLEMIEMFKLQLQKKLKNQNLYYLTKIFTQKQMQKIEQIYQKIQIYGDLLQRSIVSEYLSKQKRQQPKDKYNYEASELSSKGEIFSMLQSLKKKQVQLKLPNNDLSTQQLKIYSNKNSEARQLSDLEDSIFEKVNQAIKLLNLLELKEPIKEQSGLQPNKQKKDLLPFLPIYSSNQKIESLLVNELEIFDPYGLRIKCRKETLEINPVFIPIYQPNKKKIVKNRGIIIKTKTIEIGFIVESVHTRRKLMLFITFDQHLPKVAITIAQNSLKFIKTLNLEFQNPKLKKQFKAQLDIQGVKLYKTELKQRVLRFIKPKINIKVTQSKVSELEMKQEIPIHLYNLIEWLQIPQKEEVIFLQQAEIASVWQKVCRSVRKIKEQEILNIFPHLKVDAKGNILLKMRFLLQIIFCKIYIVLDKCKVQLINSDSETVLLAILETICQENENRQ